MHYLSHALEWVRGALFGPRTPGRHSRRAQARDVVQEAPQAAPWRLSPGVLGARLVVARRHRAERHTRHVQPPQPQGRAEWFPPHPWEDTGAMVRPYVAHLGEAPRSARAGAQADPWGAAR